MIQKVKGVVLPDYTPLVVNRSTQVITRVNSIAYESLWQFVLLANSLLVRTDLTGPDNAVAGAIRIRAFGSYTNNTGSNKNIRFLLNFGSVPTVIFDTGNIVMPSVAGSTGWDLEIIFSLKNGTTQQQSMCTTFWYNFAKAAVASVGPGVYKNLMDTLTFDTTVDNTLNFGVIMGAADSNLAVTFDYSTVEFM